MSKTRRPCIGDCQGRHRPSPPTDDVQVRAGGRMSLDMLTDAQVLYLTFEDVVESMDEAVPCDNRNHQDASGPAEWVVVAKRPCPCPTLRLWCDDCLEAELACPELNWHCPVCDTYFYGKPSQWIVSVEPLRKDAA